MLLENLDQIAADLEMQELQAPIGVATPQLYSKLLAIYLYQHDLCNAKFLWKRIPASLKSENAELRNIWAVGKTMWQRDMKAFYTLVSKTDWTENVASIMAALKDSVRERCLNLVSNAYSSVTVDSVAQLLGVVDVASLAKEHGWSVEGNLVSPVRKTIPHIYITSTEEQLHRLTSFVSILEN
uniref:COP9 signalosome complex subunit 8 n=1 Tax=Panstrongylus lignarius TaxID=156445 RepID=A0A224XZB0_9HEMI